MNINITLFYASSQEQVEIPLSIARDTTAIRAIKASGILERFPELVMHELSIGVFGQKVAFDVLLQEGDRLEIYRALLIDPKQARLNRVLQKKGVPPPYIY